MVKKACTLARTPILGPRLNLRTSPCCAALATQEAPSLNHPSPSYQEGTISFSQAGFEHDPIGSIALSLAPAVLR